MTLQPSKLALAILAAMPILAAQQAAAQSDQPVESIVVEGQYLQSNAASAMKLDIPVRDTPFSVSAYSDAFLKSLEAQSLQDTYNYMNGVKKAGQTAYDLTMRGFKTGGDDKNAIMVDGLPGLTARYSSPPTVALDHVELVKGPMSVLYGQIQPGGFVNMISKKPQATASRTLDIRAQTWAANDKPKFGQASGLTASLDLTGPLDSEKKFLYRLVGEVGSRDGFRDYTYDKGLYVAPSLTWNLSGTTYANIAYEHREAKGSFDTGVIAPASGFTAAGVAIPATSVGSVRRTTRYQEPGDYRSEIGDSLSAVFNHSFNDNLIWNTAVRSVRSHSFQDEHSPTAQAFAVTAQTNIPAGQAYVIRRARRLATDRTYDFIDSNLNATFETAFLKHKAIFGVNGGRDTTHEDRQGFVSGSGCAASSSTIPGRGNTLTLAQCASQNIEVYDPVYGRINPVVQTNPFGTGTFNATTGAITGDALNQTDTRFITNSVGLYGSDLITLTPQWKVSLGLRAMRERTITRETRARHTEYPGTAGWTAANNHIPSAGLLFQPTPEWTLYASAAQSYVPIQAQMLNASGLPGQFTKAITGKQVEAGAKAENLLNGKLTGSLAFFNIKRTDVLSTVTCPATAAAGETCNTQGAAERSRGVEVELNARPLDNWQTTFGYSFIDAKVVYSPVAEQVNSRLLNSARNSANLWTRYDIPSGPAKGLGVGVGVVYTGDRAGTVPAFNANTNSVLPVLVLPAYTTLDLALNYSISTYAFNLKVGNITDKVYYESIGQGANGVNQIAPGSARSITLSMKTTF